MITHALVAIASCCQLLGQPVNRDPEAHELVQQGLALMGGETTLRSIERVRFDMVTQWHITSFDDLPFPARISYELNTDVRDYTLNAWRNTRRFPTAVGVWRAMTDLVRDDISVRDFGSGWAPLSIAYADERDELFAYTPDRLMLAAADAANLGLAGDTSIAGLKHARLRFNAGRIPVTLFLRRVDGLPAMMHFRAAAPNDFGLVPWGEMDVEVWYSEWRTFPNKVTLPTQWDVRRIDQAYKRLSLLSAEFNGTFAADSFAVTDDLRDAYQRTATRPMHDLPFDSARIDRADTDFVEFRTPGAPAGAVRVGGRWILLETGQASLSLERALEWMRSNTEGPIDRAIVGAVATGNGGAAAHRLPLMVGPGARPFIDRILANHHRPRSDAQPVQLSRWIRIGNDSVRIERLDLPGATGSIMMWVPSEQWIWAPDALSALDLKLVRQHAAQHGWNAAWVGNRRTLRSSFN